MAKAHIAFGKVSYKIKWNKNNSLIIFLMMILKC